MQLYVFKFAESFKPITEKIISSPAITDDLIDKMICTFFQMVGIELQCLDLNLFEMRQRFKILAKNQVIKEQDLLWLAKFLTNYFTNTVNQEKYFKNKKQPYFLAYLYELVLLSLYEIFESSSQTDSECTCFGL